MCSISRVSSYWCKSEGNELSLAGKMGGSIPGVLIIAACVAYIFCTFYFSHSAMQNFFFAFPLVMTVGFGGGFFFTALPWIPKDDKSLQNS